MEGGEELMAIPSVVRATYLEALQSTLELYRRELASAGIDYQLMDTSQPLEFAQACGGRARPPVLAIRLIRRFRALEDAHHTALEARSRTARTALLRGGAGLARHAYAAFPFV